MWKSVLILCGLVNFSSELAMNKNFRDEVKSFKDFEITSRENLLEGDKYGNKILI